MASTSNTGSDKTDKGGKKVRVPFRQNRSTKRRERDWTQHAVDDGQANESVSHEQMKAKGDLSRYRTITVYDHKEGIPDGMKRGVVIALRGLFVEVDDGQRTIACTVRRILRTRLIKERHPVTVGDRVIFRLEGDTKGVESEGVIETVEDRRGQLRRQVGRRIHTIVANVDQAIIVASADQPTIKPHLIDRYIVASLAGEIQPVVCVNKIDLDEDGSARKICERYTNLGYTVLVTSATTGEGIEDLRQCLKDKESVIAGQSGVGKSTLLNAVEPGLKLRTGDISEQLNKGKHTTTTAVLLKLSFGGYVVDTPGVRSFDLSTVGKHELEALFVEMLPFIPDCKFADCTHTHEISCAVKQAVEDKIIHPDRYDSYVRMFQDES